MIFKLAWKNIWRNRRRTIITISAIAFAVMFAVLLRSMQLGMQEQMVDSIVDNNLGYIQIHAKGFWEEKTLDNGFYSDDIPYDEILNHPEIISIDKKLEAGALSSSGIESRGTFVMSYDQEKEIPKRIINNIYEGVFPDPQRNEVLLGEDLADYLDVKIGDTIVYLGQGYQGATAADLFTVSGLIDLHIPELNKIISYVNMSNLQNFISAPKLLTALLIDIKNPDKVNEIKQDLEKIVGPDYEVMTWQDMNPQLQQLIVSSDAEGWIMNFILYMIITFVMFGTVLMATQERRYELGVLLAIGMRKRKTSIMVIVENIITNMLGVIVGIIIVSPIAYYFNINPIIITGDQAELIEKMGFEAVIPFSVDPNIALVHASIVLTISIILLLYPIFIIKNLKPVEAMKL